ILRILISIRRRYTLERIGYPHPPIGHAEEFEDGTHQNTRSTSPDASFHEITRNIVDQDIFETGLQIVEGIKADHGRPLHLHKRVKISRYIPSGLHIDERIHLSVEEIKQRTFQQIEIKCFDMIHCIYPGYTPIKEIGKDDRH